MESKKNEEKIINTRKNVILDQIRINELNSDYQKMILKIL